MWLLIPLSAVLVLAILAVFGWALHRGQFEDLEHEGERILLDEPAAGMTAVPDGRAAAEAVDADQARFGVPPEQSPKSKPRAQRQTQSTT